MKNPGSPLGAGGPRGAIGVPKPLVGSRIPRASPGFPHLHGIAGLQRALVVPLSLFRCPYNDVGFNRDNKERF